MTNLQTLIKKTHNSIIINEKKLNIDLEKFKSLSENILKNNLNNTELQINKNDFYSITKTINNIKKILDNYYDNLKAVKNKGSLISNKALEVICPIGKIITNFKNIQNKIILVQNKFALSGKKNDADNFAKLSLELNYENHLLVKNTSHTLKNIKELIS